MAKKVKTAAGIELNGEFLALSLPDKLKTLRGERSQESVARQLNCSLSAYTSWEQGKRSPSWEWMQKIADNFGLTTEQLRVKKN